MRWIRLAMLTVLVLRLSGAVTADAEDGEAEPATMGPLEIVDDCIAAAEQGDIARYVDHLSPEEQKLQAGYALLFTSLCSQTLVNQGGTADPETLLLSRALTDLVRQHSLSEDVWNSEQQAAAQARVSLVNLAMSAAFVQAGVALPNYGTSSSGGIRESCIKSTGMLKDPRQFLIAVLTEAMQPMQVSGEAPAQPVSLSTCVDVTKEYAELKWTLFTRGDYAVAVAARPARQSPAPPSAGGEGAPTCPAANTPQHQIEFRRIDGQWKVDRLLPTSAIMPTACAAPATVRPPTWDPCATPCPAPGGVAPATTAQYPLHPITPPTPTAPPR